MIELTDEQRRELTEPETTVVDPATNETYVLVRKEVYEKLKAPPDDDIDMETVGLLVERIMKEDDANDPYLESYQKYLDQP